MTYDAARGEVALFGGADNSSGFHGDTWTWDGTHWRVPFVAKLSLSPQTGPPGTVVQAKGKGFGAFEQVTVTFIDSIHGTTLLGTFTTGRKGQLNAQVTIPSNASAGSQKITAVGAGSNQKAAAKFLVT
jgi:hypothetical protein